MIYCTIGNHKLIKGGIGYATINYLCCAKCIEKPENNYLKQRMIKAGLYDNPSTH